MPPLILAERPHKRQKLATLFQVSTKTISRHIDRLPNHYPTARVLCADLLGHLTLKYAARSDSIAPIGYLWGYLCVR